MTPWFPLRWRIRLAWHVLWCRKSQTQGAQFGESSNSLGTVYMCMGCGRRWQA